MKILVAGNLFYYDKSALNCTYPFFIEPMIRMGYDVQILDIRPLNKKGGSFLVAKMLLSYIRYFKPDVLFTIPSRGELAPWVLNIVTKYTNTITLAWNSDDDRRWDDYSSLYAPVYDYMVTTYPSIYKRAHASNFDNVLLSQWGANVHMITPATQHEREYDVCFVGAAYGDRPAYIDNLKKEGISVKVAGMNWAAHVLGAEEDVTDMHMQTLYRKAKIILVFSKGYQQTKSQIKARVFEGPAYRVCTFVERAPGLEDLYEIGQEIVVFENENDLVTKVKYYLSHDAEREAIAQSGYARVVKDHTCYGRLKLVFESIKRKRTSFVYTSIGKVLCFMQVYTRGAIVRLKRIVKTALMKAGVI